MDVIDGNWLRARLTGAHGEQRKLADAVGIGQDKITKILTGVRTIRPTEAPKFIAYFATAQEPGGMADPPAHFIGSSAVVTTAGPGIHALMTALCPKAKHPVIYSMTRNEPGAALLRGDLLMVDLAHKPAQGDLVLVTKNDPDTDSQDTIIRRFLPPYLLDPNDPAAPPEPSEASLHSAVLATILASARPKSPD